MTQELGMEVICVYICVRVDATNLHGYVLAERFILESEAGRGGMGVVYRAFDSERGGYVAVKVLLDADEELAQRFLREAQILATFDHPGIVHHVAHGLLHDGTPYLVMEWLEGEDLAARLRRGGLDVGQTVVVAMQIAQALEVVHAKGIVHRDIKPENVFLLEKSIEQIRLLDFGVAHMSYATRGLTLAGQVLGTAAYMAPEQIRATETIDRRADLYALGSVMFECLTGRPPFWADHPVAILTKALFEDPPRLRECISNVPVELDEWIARVLDKDPARRPNSVSELLALLSKRRESEETPSQMAQSLATRERSLVCIVLVASTDERPLERIAPIQMYSEPTLSVPANDMILHAEKFAARIEPLGSGYFAALLAGDTASSDLATRAARFALELRPTHSNATIAIAFGRNEPGLLGVVIDRAATLLNASGKTIVDATVARLLASKFHVEELAGRWILSGESTAYQSTERLRTLFVGRERELSMLMSYFDAWIEDEPRATAVIVTAPAGCGKTRLLHELLRVMRTRELDAEIGLASGDPIGTNSPFCVISALLRYLCGICRNTSPGLARQSILAYVETWLSGPTTLRVARFVAELLDVPFDEPDDQLSAARADPILMGNQIRRACEDLFAAICDRRPLVFILDDMQWGDVATAKLLDGVLRHLKDAPFAVVAFARPDVEDTLPNLWRERNAQWIRLSPLTSKACIHLIRTMLGSDVADHRVRDIVEHAGGNAFFLEELLRAELAGAGGVFPDTVLSMVQLRIERLDSEIRRALRVASLFGTAFGTKSVAALLRGVPAHIEAIFSQLVNEDILVQRSGGDSRETFFSFRHAFLRDAAYEMLTDEDRVLGHLLLAEQLETSLQHDAATIAQHFERGAAPERAVPWWTIAVEEAIRGNDMEGAINRGLHALELEAPSDSKGLLRLHVATAYCWSSRFADAEEHATAAMDLLPAGSTNWYGAAERLNWSYVVRGLLERSDVLAKRLFEQESTAAPSNERGIAWAALAQAYQYYGDTAQADRWFAAAENVAKQCVDCGPLEARMATVAGTRWFFAHNLGRASAELTRAALLYERIGDLRNATLEKVNAAIVLISLGAYRSALVLFQQALDQYEQFGLHARSAWIRHCIGRAKVLAGAAPEGFSLMMEAAVALNTSGNQRAYRNACAECAWLLVWHGHIQAAEKIITEVFASGLVDSTAPLAYSARAHVHLAQNNSAAALEDAQLAAGLAANAGDREHLIPILFTLAQTLRRCGQTLAAQQTLREAVDVIDSASALLEDEEQRRIFRENVPEHRETLQLAVVWHAEPAHQQS